MVDFILYRTLDDVDPDMEGLDDLLITLPDCGHVFTVETLDGHVSLSEYYRSDDDGHWIGLKTSGDGFRKPPTCPTCRIAIRANRYGRVYKRADLDILENNVASRMSQSLSAISQRLDDILPEELKTRLKAAAGSSNLSVQRAPRNTGSQQKQQSTCLKQSRSTPVPVTALDPSNDKLHCIPPPEVRAWRSVVQSLSQIYHDAVAVAATRSAHMHAWEASFAYLHREEMERAMLDPGAAPRNPHVYATRVARLGVGQPQPRADRRFHVEALWISIRIRLILAELAQTWAAALASRPSYPQENKRLWHIFISFIFRSCLHDSFLIFILCALCQLFAPFL